MSSPYLTRLGLCLTFSLTMALRAAPPIGFEEKFALATDRAAVLKDLILGTPEYYYYAVLHAQNTNLFPEATRLLTEWATRFPEENPQRTLLETRQHFFDYTTNPNSTLAFLKETNGLTFDHAREVAGTPPEIPLALDPALLTWEAFYAAAKDSDPTLATLTDAGLRTLFYRGLTKALPSETRRAILPRLTRPDLPGLIDVILADLTSKQSSGFGEFPIHQNLLLTQLETLLAARPKLLENLVFVETWLARLTPPDGLDPERDPAVRLAWLERLQVFAEKLPPAHNTIKTSILYARLAHDLQQNTPDSARLLAYLKLPRPVAYLNPTFRDNPTLFRYQADLTCDLASLIGQGPIVDDTELVRRTLLLLLAKNPKSAPYQPYLESSFLNSLLAEAQLTNAPGTAEQFAVLLSPASLAALNSRTDLEFDPSNRQTWLPADLISLDLHLKNIPHLLIKVFEINTENVHRISQRQVNTDLDLDGLVANQETSQDYPSPPLQRTRRTFTFPQLTGKRGVWIIEFIGGGKSSRTLVRKGGLTVLPIQTGAGTRLTVLDETSTPVPTAFALLGSQRFPANNRGHILLPFSTTPGEKEVIIDDGSGFTTLESVELQGESYSLTVGVHVPRESLLPGQTATALLRPVLLCNNRATTLTALENSKITLTAITLEGIATITVIPLNHLNSDQEVTLPFQVPDRLASLEFTFSGEVKSLITSQSVSVTSHQLLEINGITLSSHTSDLQLTPSKDGWSISQLGRNGEPLIDRQLNLSATHRDFTNAINTSLRTTSDGSSSLGSIPGITSLSFTNAEELERLFVLPRDSVSQSEELVATVGEPVRLAWPYQVPQLAFDPVGKSSRLGLTLIEIRNDQFIRSVTEGISLKNGLLEITGLAVGVYSLYIEELSKTIRLVVSEGRVVDGYLSNPTQNVALSSPDPIVITGLTSEKITLKNSTVPVDSLAITLVNVNASTRVHLLVSRFLPQFDAFASLSNNALVEPTSCWNPFRPSLYQSARILGEEYRYVLERQSLKSFAGNFLARPGLLLNPWAIADTSTEKQEAAQGEAPTAMVAERNKKGASPLARGYSQLAPGAREISPLGEAQEAEKPDIGLQPISPDLSFLAQPGATAFNLKPDADGKVHLALAGLGHGQFLRVIALSGDSAAVRDFTLPEKPLQTSDLRLAHGLDPAAHFSQQNTVNLLEKEVPFKLTDAFSSRYQIYSNLNSAWDLLYNLSQNPTLDQFALLRSWPSLDDHDKRIFYSKFGCHELNFFLFRKDPKFFKSVIQPFLANKRDQTFLDEYLLEKNLTSFLDLPRYFKLNTAEKILLAHRSDATQREATRRDLSDFLKTLIQDPSKQSFRFESALRRGQLEIAKADAGLWLGKDFHSKDGSAPVEPFSNSEALPASSVVAPAPIQNLTNSSDRLVESDDKNGSNRRGGGDEEAGLRADFKGRALYRQAELTKELAENNYYQRPISNQNADLIQPNRYWQDYALWDGTTPFLSANLSEASNNFTEIILALAVLDLPFEADAKLSQSTIKDGVLTLTPSASSLLFHQETKIAELDTESSPLLVSQNFYREGERYLEENGEKADKFVSGEFLAGTVYGCQITVTNSSSSRRKFEVLFQIPVGSLPVKNTRLTQSVPIQLEGFRTQTIDFHFYFPQPGSFAHYPVHVSRDGKVSAFAVPATFKVVTALTALDTTSWEYLSQQGSHPEVLSYLKQHNLHQTDIERCAWRLKDRAFYDQLVALLRSRKFYHETTFSYSILYDDLPALRDYLAFQGNLLQDPLDSPLLTINPVEQKTFQWLEYSPLVNARAHQLGGDRVILNNKFREQYQAFLHLLSFRPVFTAEDQLGLAAVLLLQDRLSEAKAAFSQVDPSKIRERLPYDYLEAWLAYSAADLATARRIATARIATSLPDHWLARFQELTAQLDEIDGKAPAAPRPEDRDAKQDRRAAAEPQFAVKVEGKTIILDYRNLTEVTVNYYPMDLEFLFSANPFVGQDTGRFRSIRPNQTERLSLSADKTNHSFQLPNAWQNANVLVEITSAGLTKVAASYANQLDIQISENFGQLQVRQLTDQRPLPRAYVKVFAEIEGRPVFYKDGYTDLRGKFDYASLSTDDLSKTTRFSLLILTKENGATVREVKPPAR